MIIGPVEHKTNNRFEIMVVFESYINAIDIDYDNEDVTSTGYVFKTNTSQFNVVNRSAYSKETNYMQQMVEYHGKNCYIPTSGKCFINCINYLTEKDFTEEFWTFIKIEKYRSGVMISARIQSFCRKYSINIGCFDWTRINPRNITQRNTSLFIHNNNFWLICKAIGISSSQATEEFKNNFKVFGNVISDKHVKNLIQFEYIPKKVQSPLANLVVCGLETFNEIVVVPYCSCIDKLSKFLGKYHQDISEQEYQKCLYDCVVYKATNCNNEMLDLVLLFKGEAKKV